VIVGGWQPVLPHISQKPMQRLKFAVQFAVQLLKALIALQLCAAPQHVTVPATEVHVPLADVQDRVVPPHVVVHVCPAAADRGPSIVARATTANKPTSKMALDMALSSCGTLSEDPCVLG
jgi:hypothetical protein